MDVILVLGLTGLIMAISGFITVAVGNYIVCGRE